MSNSNVNKGDTTVPVVIVKHYFNTILVIYTIIHIKHFQCVVKEDDAVYRFNAFHSLRNHAIMTILENDR